jgi:hypothetical protein
MRVRMTILPKRLKAVAVSTTMSPVTQTAEVAVNQASIKERLFPSADAKGSVNSRVPRIMITWKLARIDKAGLDEIRFMTDSIERIRSDNLYKRKMLRAT